MFDTLLSIILLTSVFCIFLLLYYTARYNNSVKQSKNCQCALNKDTEFLTSLDNVIRLEAAAIKTGLSSKGKIISQIDKHELFFNSIDNIKNRIGYRNLINSQNIFDNIDIWIDCRLRYYLVSNHDF